MGTENIAEPIRWYRLHFLQPSLPRMRPLRPRPPAASWKRLSGNYGRQSHIPPPVWPHPQSSFPWGLGSSESSRSSRQRGSQKPLPLTQAGPSAAEGCKLAGADVGGLGGFSGELSSLYVSGLMFNSETATLTILREGCPGPHFTHAKANTERGHAHLRQHSCQVGGLGPQRSQL